MYPSGLAYLPRLAVSKARRMASRHSRQRREHVGYYIESYNRLGGLQIYIGLGMRALN